MNILLLLQTFASTIASITIAIAVSLAPRRYAVASSMAGVAILALGLVGWWEFAAGPKDLWLRYPWMVTWLHPYVLGLDCVLAPVIGLGVAIKGCDILGICASRPGTGCKQSVVPSVLRNHQ
jgi:hypothetical protein